MQVSVKGVIMFKFLNNEKGAILTYVVVIVIALISLISSLSLGSLIQSDSLQKNYQHDLIQEDILLRSEGVRSQLSVEIYPNRLIPGRNVDVNAGDKRVTTYIISNSKVLTNISNFMGYATKQAIKVTSKVIAKRKKASGHNPSNQATKLYGSIDSPAVRLTERYLQNQSLSQWQYFTNHESSINADGGQAAAAVKFWGPDVLWGPLHSNSDIFIQQLGGGDNQNWPTFHGFVSTTGEILLPSGVSAEDSGAPMEQIFRGGFAEEVDPIGFEPTADLLRANGDWLFNEGDFDLCYVILEGSNAAIHKGIVTSYVQEINHLSWYPADESWVNYAIGEDVNWFMEADTIATSYVTMYDTTWVVGAVGAPNNSSFFAPGEMWIRGEVAGNQCWGASGKVRITGDITYRGTNVGDTPDGFSGLDEETGQPTYNGPINRYDYFGLVTENKMYVAYKSYSPDTEHELEEYNVEGGENNHVYLYGAYAALAQGDEAIYGDMFCHYDGEFAFEYQHPHGSTPNFRARSPYTWGPDTEDTLYTHIDLHKFIYPVNNLVPPFLHGFNLHCNGGTPNDPRANGYPNVNMAYRNSLPNNGNNYVYPWGTDWPWYNPVWPEAINDWMFERGTIHNFGSIAQTRRGFIHRSGSDPYNHTPDNEWNMDQYHFGGTHGSTGYDKDYSYDNRFTFVQPKDFPEVYQGHGGATTTPFQAYNWFFKIPSDN